MQEELLKNFRDQVSSCRSLGSEIWAALLERCLVELETGGPVRDVFTGDESRPILNNTALRLMGAVHYLALRGDAPALAARLPSTGGRFEPDAAWAAVRELAKARRDELRQLIREPLQTNEVRRSCALVGGFLSCARAFDLPLRIREIGASAGLNLGFDRYHYTLGPHAYGPEDAALRLACDWSGPPPPLDAPLRVADRAGVDLSPIDLRDPDRALRLQSFVWPDLDERLATLRAATAVAQSHPPALEQASADRWVPRQLAELPSGHATVLFQSVMWWYLRSPEREAVTAAVEEAGTRARTEAPLAWLRLEGHDPGHCELRLRTWPGNEERFLARAHWHGAWVDWQPA